MILLNASSLLKCSRSLRTTDRLLFEYSFSIIGLNRTPSLFNHFYVDSIALRRLAHVQSSHIVKLGELERERERERERITSGSDCSSHIGKPIREEESLELGLCSIDYQKLRADRIEEVSKIAGHVVDATVPVAWAC
jgi:hypothetical protein